MAKTCNMGQVGEFEYLFDDRAVEKTVIVAYSSYFVRISHNMETV
jgi:hypothetical protein